MSLFTAIIICGCEKVSNDINPTIDQQEQETVIVSLGLGGEITISETPLSSRAAGSETSSKDIYAINVFYDKEKDGVINDTYARGLFDNIEDMVITLLSGYKYRFECTYVPNGKECSSFFRSSNYTDYTFGNTQITNRFYSNSTFANMYFGDCYNNTTYSKSSNYSTSSFQRFYGPANYDRYYGELDNYTPKAGEKAVVEMIRCVFGLKVVVSGLTDGSLSLGTCFGDSWTVTEDGVARDQVRAFIDIYKCWKSYQDYSVTESMSISWTRGNGVKQDLGSQDITVKRNILTTVNINLVGSSTNNSIGLDVKSGDMGNSTINININADGTVDTNVDPQH